MSISLTEVSKKFGSLEVLKGVNYQFKQGKITCILGPNGSGKTTLMKSILGLVKPNNGDISINEESILKNHQLRRVISYVPQIARFPENLKVIELLNFIQEIRKEKGNPQPLIELFEIESFLNKTLKTLSGGTRQKVNLVCALMFETSIIILDEPTSGLDPISNIRLKKLLLDYKAAGKTIIFSTHLLYLTEEIADELIFILDGKVNYEGSPENLMKTEKASNLEEAIAKKLQNSRHD